MDRGLPSVRSARGLQGRQELGRMLVCVTDFVLRPGALGQLLRETSKRGRRSQTSILRVVSTASPLSISSLEACATFHSTDDRARPGCQTFAAERCKLLLITSTQISSIHPQYGPSLRTRIVIISRHVRSRGVDELKMLLLMPQKFNIPTLKIRCLLETLGEVFDR